MEERQDQSAELNAEERAIARFERYFEGNMPPEEAERFEAELQASTELQKEFAAFAAVMQGAAQAGAQDFMQQLRKWDRESASPRQISTERREGRIRRFSPLMRLAAVVLLLLIPLLFLLRKPGTPQGPIAYEELYDQHFEPYDNILTLRGEEPASVAVTEAMNAYEASEFEKAATALNAVLKSDPGNVTYRLYAGIAELASGHEEEALKHLEVVQDQDTSAWQPQAEWYVGLTYLRMGDLQAARDALSGIAEQSSHPYQSRAKSLTDQLAR